MNLPAIIEAKDLVAFDAMTFDGFYQKVKEQYWIDAPDISTEESRDRIRSAAAKVAKLKRDVERQADSLKAEAANVVKTINAGKKEALDKMQELQDTIRKPLTDWEDLDKNRIAGHEAKIAEIEALKQHAQDIDPAELDLRLEALGGIAQRDWQEFGNRATMAINMTRDHLTATKGRRVKEIADAAELAELRRKQEEQERKDREDRIAKEATAAAEAAAKIEAERKAKSAAEAQANVQRAAQEANERAAKAEADKLAAAQKAEQDRVAAAEKAEADRVAAEAAATKREQERQAAETKRVADETAMREKDKTHKAKIHNEILAALSELHSGSQEEMKAIIKAIAQGKIPHVSIGY